MKYTSIIAATALVGADAYNLKNQNKLYAAINDESLVQVEEAKINEQAWGGIEASMHEFPGTVNEHGNWQDAYERVLPERFQGDAADGTAPVDKFTQNLIENYAVEGIDGKKIKDQSQTVHSTSPRRLVESSLRRSSAPTSPSAALLVPSSLTLSTTRPGNTMMSTTMVESTLSV